MRVTMMGPIGKGVVGGVRGVMEAFLCMAREIPGLEVRAVDAGSKGSGSRIRNLTNRVRCLVRQWWTIPRGSVLHFQAARTSILADAATMAVLRPRSRAIVAHVHCQRNALDTATRWQRFGWSLLRLAAHKLLVIAPGIERQFEPQWSSDVAVIPNFVDALHIAAVTKETPRERLVVFFGRMRRSKGIFALLDVAGMLEPLGWGIRFIGPFDAEEEEREFVERLERVPNAEWLGSLSGDEKYRALATGRVFALPSSHHGEVFPVAMLEAGCVGCAPVVTTVGSIEDVLQDEEEGVLLESSSPEELGRVLAELLVDESRIERLGVAWRKAVESKYSKESVRRDYETLLRSLP